MTRDRSLRDALGGVLGILGGLAFASALAFGAFSYIVSFARDQTPWSSDGVVAVIVDVVLFSVFALHHSAFARLGLKDRVTRLVSPRYERTTYVWIASALFVGVCAVWRDVPGVLWRASAPWSWGLAALQVAGVAMTLHASRELSALSLAGVHQALGRSADRPPTVIRHGLYALVRHPIYLAWACMVWPAPLMTGTRLTFAAASTLYLFLAVPFEERTLRREFGGDYDAYARRVRWRIVPFVY